MKACELINESSFDPDEQIIDLITDIFIQKNLIDLEQEFCLKLTDAGSISGYNRKYRGKNKETDVLSFPSEFKEIPFLGDILIDISVADRQKGNKLLMEEVGELIIHGLLHLLGYDHINESEKIKMETSEEEIKKIFYQKFKNKEF